MIKPSEDSPFLKVLPWILPAALIISWFLVCRTGLVPAYLIPPPADIGRSAWQYIFGTPGDAPYAGRFIMDAKVSLIRVFLGFSIASVLGIPLGIMSGRMLSVQKFLSTAVNAARAVPGICWLPLALVWFGIGVKTTVFLVALAAFFPVYLNAAAGARQVNLKLLQAGAMMGVNRIRGTYAILIPGAMPHIMTGLRLGLGISWAYLVLGELTGVTNGLGAVIMDARMLGRIDIIVVGILLIAVMGQISDQLLTFFMRCCFKSVRRMT